MKSNKKIKRAMKKINRMNNKMKTKMRSKAIKRMNNKETKKMNNSKKAQKNKNKSQCQLLNLWVRNLHIKICWLKLHQLETLSIISLTHCLHVVEMYIALISLKSNINKSSQELSSRFKTRNIQSWRTKTLKLACSLKLLFSRLWHQNNNQKNSPTAYPTKALSF